MSKAHQRRAQRQSEAATMAAFYTDGPGALLVTEEPTTMDTLSTVVIQYPATDEQIAGMREEFSGINFTDSEGYERGRKAIAALRSFRGAVEKKRKELKADSLEFGRRVDSTAKHFTGLILEIEEPLQAKKEAVDNAKEIARRAAEDAEREAVRLAELAKLEEQRAELARIEEEQRVAREAETARQAEESQRLEAQSAELARQAQAQADERAALQRERDAFEAQRRAAAALIPAPTETVERYIFNGTGPTPAVPATQEAVDAALAEDIAEAFPSLSPGRMSAPPIDWVAGESQDSARLRAFAAALRGVARPAVDSDTAAAVLEQVEFILEEAFQALESFGGEKEAATAAE